MITPSQLTEVGRIGKPHGIAGELNAYLDRDVATDAMRRVVVEVDGIFVPFFVASLRRKGAATLIMALDDIASERQAAELTNHALYVLTDDGVVLDDDDDDDEPGDEAGFYAADLIGFTVVDYATGAALGTVADVDDTTDNVLFVVERPGGGPELYLPVADELIVAVDPGARTLEMSLPQGILDL